MLRFSTGVRALHSALCTVLVCLAFSAATPNPVAAQRASDAELKEMSRRLWEEQIRKDGRVTDPRRNAMVKEIVTRLSEAISQPGLKLNWAIMNNDTVNAWATPGGYIAVFRGLMDFADSMARLVSRRDTAMANRISASWVAAVLAHEISHVTLAHGSDPTVSNCMERMNEVGGVTRDGSQPARGETESRLIKSSVDCMHYSQAQELAADRLGAFYLLRQNWRGATDWSIQSMIDFFRMMDRQDREKLYYFSPYLTSYLSTHPRNSTRIAELEAYRARLKMNQTRFDDALSFIANNMELELAGALLDSVLVDFPDLVAAKQAKAAVVMRRYLNSVPVQMQQVRVSVPTNRAVFLDDIRGEEMGDEQLRTEALRLFTDLRTLDNSGATMSNLAVLEAYNGDLVQAQVHAVAATALDLESPELRNNNASVLYLAGKYAQARDEYKAILDKWGENGPIWVVLPVFFNYGRTLLALNDPQGREIMERYLQNDDTSEWAREARRLLGRTSPPRPSKKTDGSTGAKNAAFGFGASRADVIAAWGQPDGSESSGGLELLSWRNGRQIILHPDKGVGAFIYSTRDAGELDGVQVGDPLTRITSRRRPAEVRDDVYFFSGEGTVTIVKVQGGNIVQLALAIPD